MNLSPCRSSIYPACVGSEQPAGIFEGAMLGLRSPDFLTLRRVV